MRSNLLFTQSCNSVDNLLTACLYSSKLSSGDFSTNYEDILSEVGAIWKERCCSRLTEQFLSLQDPFYHKVVICQQIYLERILWGFLNVFNHYSNYLFSTLRVVMQCNESIRQLHRAGQDQAHRSPAVPRRQLTSLSPSSNHLLGRRRFAFTIVSNKKSNK